MFGFLRPRPQSDDYRRAYARLCVHQRQRLGLRSLPFHSYEAVFLYQLALDAGAVAPECLPNVRCCKLAYRSSVTVADDAEAGLFCASFAVLLASIKIDDDVRDSRSGLARFARFFLRSRIAVANRHLAKFDPAFESTVAAFVAAHNRLERPGVAISLEAYAAPTGEAFGYLFGLFAIALHLPDVRSTFVEIGRGVGRALIAFDCAADWQRDRARGEFNPLPDEAAVKRALETCWGQLNDIADLARIRFGHRSRAARTASGVADRIAGFHPQGMTCPARPNGWVILKVALERSWLGLTTGQLALAGVTASTGDNGQPTDAEGPPVDRPESWRRSKEQSETPEGPISSKKRDDWCEGTCLGGLCACEGADCCCAIAACL